MARVSIPDASTTAPAYARYTIGPGSRACGISTDRKKATGSRTAAVGKASRTNQRARSDSPVSSTYRSAIRDRSNNTPA
jgi:hypothetical protein